MALSKYYVDHVAGNDTTGTGTALAPWATLQKAFNTITRTNEDCIFVSGNTTLAAAQSLATYGDRPAATGLTYIVGVGSPRPKITYTHATGLFTTGNGLVFINLEFEGTHATPSAHDFALLLDCSFYNCKLKLARSLTAGVGSRIDHCEILGGDGAFQAAIVAYAGTILRSYIHSFTTNYAISPAADALLANNVFIGGQGAAAIRRMMIANQHNVTVSGNIFIEDSAEFTQGPVLMGSSGQGLAFCNNIWMSSRAGAIFVTNPQHVWILRGNRKHPTPTWGTAAGGVVSELNTDDNDLTLANWGKVFVDPANGDFRLRKNWTAPSPFGVDPLMFPGAKFPGVPAFASMG